MLVKNKRCLRLQSDRDRFKQHGALVCNEFLTGASFLRAPFSYARRAVRLAFNRSSRSEREELRKVQLRAAKLRNVTRLFFVIQSGQWTRTSCSPKQDGGHLIA